jgi:DNA end-binding protein Ku
LRAMWKGFLGFGLVNIPVGLFAATQNNELKFRYLHSECHTPLEYQKVCPSCKREIPWEEIVRGYEYEKDHFVILSAEEFKSAAGEKEKVIEIEDFVNIEEVDPIYLQKSYYLAPDGPGKRPYALLYKAMLEEGKAAVATFTLRTKESPAVVRVYGNLLSLATMFYPDEVRPVGELPTVSENMEVKEKELQIAKDLIQSLTAPFEPQKYRNNYREKLLQIIEGRVEGKEVSVAPAPEREKVVDLLAALQASVGKAKEARGRGKVPANEGEKEAKKAASRPKKAAASRK